MIQGKKHINGSKTSRLQNKSEMRSQGFISWPTQWTNLVGFISGHLPGKPFGPGDTEGTTIVKSNGPGTLLFSIQFTKFTLDITWPFGHHFDTFPQVLLENCVFEETNTAMRSVKKATSKSFHWVEQWFLLWSMEQSETHVGRKVSFCISWRQDRDMMRNTCSIYCFFGKVTSSNLPRKFVPSICSTEVPEVLKSFQALRA